MNSCPFFYGWVILAVGAVGSIMTSPGQTYAVSVFLGHIVEDLGLSRTQVSSLYSAGTLTACLFLPLVGRSFDRRGARFMMWSISLLLGLACIYMSFVSSALMLGLGFFALRMLGQGSLSLVSRNVVNLWWVRRRGMAMGIVGLTSTLLGVGGFPSLINWLITLCGWRLTYVVLGGLVLGVMMPLALFFIRDRPEDFGLQPDGGETSQADVDNAAPTEQNWTLSEALRTRAFWLVSAGLSAMSMLNTGLTFHLFDIFHDGGLSSAVAASVFVPIALTGAVVQLGSGILIDRIPIRLMLAVALLLEAVILLLAPSLQSVEMAYVFGLLMGTQAGVEMIIGSVVWAQFFGRLHIGSITGVATMVMVGSSALGPLPFGVGRDLLGSYQPVLHAFALVPLILAPMSLLFCSAPKK